MQKPFFVWFDQGIVSSLALASLNRVIICRMACSCSLTNWFLFYPQTHFKIITLILLIAQKASARNYAKVQKQKQLKEKSEDINNSEDHSQRTSKSEHTLPTASNTDQSRALQNTENEETQTEKLSPTVPELKPQNSVAVKEDTDIEPPQKKSNRRDNNHRSLTSKNKQSSTALQKLKILTPEEIEKRDEALKKRRRLEKLSKLIGWHTTEDMEEYEKLMNFEESNPSQTETDDDFQFPNWRSKPRTSFADLNELLPYERPKLEFAVAVNGFSLSELEVFFKRLDNYFLDSEILTGFVIDISKIFGIGDNAEEKDENGIPIKQQYLSPKEKFLAFKDFVQTYVIQKAGCDLIRNRRTIQRLDDPGRRKRPWQSRGCFVHFVDTSRYKGESRIWFSNFENDNGNNGDNNGGNSANEHLSNTAHTAFNRFLNANGEDMFPKVKNSDIVLLYEALREWNPEFYTEVNPPIYFRHILGEDKYNNRENFFRAEVLRNHVLAAGVSHMHLDDDTRFARWSVVDYNTDTPKKIAGKLLNNQNGIRLRKLLWMYTNGWAYLKSFHNEMLRGGPVN